MDDIDLKAVKHLMTRGRATWSELAGVLELSAPSAAERVKRLEERGVIKGYAALLDPEALGLALTAFVFLTIERPQHREGLLKKVAELPEIQECHHITGDYDYLLKIRCSGARELEHTISEQLKGVPGVSKTHTTVALSTIKETQVLALQAGSAPQTH